MVGRKLDPKADSLRKQGCLNSHPEKVTDEFFVSSEFFDPRDLLQVKYEMLRRVREEGCPVSHSAALVGLSRPSYYQAQKAYDEGGMPALLPKKPKGLVAAYELLVVTPAIANLIREAKTFRINSAIQTGRKYGMQLLDDALFDLWRNGICEENDVVMRAVHSGELKARIDRAKSGLLDDDDEDDDFEDDYDD